MDTILAVTGAAAGALYLACLLGGPMLLTDWLRHRQEETIRHQIALTDAIDATLGPLVTPTVRKPLWGPWQIRIAVPFTRPLGVGRVLAVVREALSAAERMAPGWCEIILTPSRHADREETGARPGPPAKRRPHEDRLAA